MKTHSGAALSLSASRWVAHGAGEFGTARRLRASVDIGWRFQNFNLTTVPRFNAILISFWKKCAWLDSCSNTMVNRFWVKNFHLWIFTPLVRCWPIPRSPSSSAGARNRPWQPQSRQDSEKSAVVSQGKLHMFIYYFSGLVFSVKDVAVAIIWLGNSIRSSLAPHLRGKYGNMNTPSSLQATGYFESPNSNFPVQHSPPADAGPAPFNAALRCRKH